MRRLALAMTLVLCDSLVHGQETQPARAERPITESAERIARDWQARRIHERVDREREELERLRADGETSN
jgi:hypothetical protein